MLSRKIRKAMKALDFVAFFSVYSLFSLVYKKPLKKGVNIVGFASSHFSGNVKYLHREMKKQRDIKVFFVTGEKEELERLRSSDVDACYYMDIKRIPLFLRTDVWVTSHGWNYIPFVGIIRRLIPFYGMKRSSKWVDVWHGLAFVHTERGKMLRHYDLGFVTSEFFKEYYSKEGGEKVAKIIKITGYPRNDPLINGRWSREELEKELGISKGCKNILYAPTWGHKFKKKIFPWESTSNFLRQIEEFCEKYNCNFLIRMHPNWYLRNPNEVKQIENEAKYAKRIVHVSHYKYEDVQPLLYVSDVLITDWSSVANDYILLNRPIIFLETTFPVQKFVLRPEDRAGYIVKNKEEFFEKLSEAVTKPNLLQQKRKKVIKKLYKYIDGNSSKRCAQEILKLLN
jgi:CDP-glycerol glycerophosphotransferase (TagB/SpsB family)